MYYLRIYDWNPNGTNDVEIVQNGKMVDYIPEALFGYQIDPFYYDTHPAEMGSFEDVCVVPWSLIAISPVNDGTETLKTLKKYFK